MQCLLKEFIGAGIVPLMFFYVTKVKEACCVMGIFLKAFVEVLLRLFEAPKMAVCKPHKRVGTSRRINFDELLKFIDRLFGSAGHEITFTECCVKVGTLRRYFQASPEQRNRVLKKVLGHAE